MIQINIAVLDCDTYSAGFLLPELTLFDVAL